MIRDCLRFGVIVILAAGLVGCRSTSHTSVQTYQYSEEPPPEQRQEADSDYEMVSPGEMIVE